MPTKIIVKRCPYRGRRPNLSPQETSFPYNAEDPVHLEDKAARQAKAARALTILGAVLVWLPVVLTLAYFVYVTLIGQPQSFMVYVTVFSSVRLLDIVGGVLLYIAARLAHLLNRLIGWAALGMALVPFIGSVLMVVGVSYSFAAASSLFVVGYYISLAAVVFALCLNVLSIFLLKGLFPQKQTGAGPDMEAQSEL